MRAPWLRGLRRCQGTYLASQGARRFVRFRFAKCYALTHSRGGLHTQAHQGSHTLAF